MSGAEVAERLLVEAGVCVLAGTAFGGIGVNHIRISYANSRENLTEALGRIRRWVEPLVAAGSTGAAGDARAAGASAGATSGAR
jgi:aminotransferase